MDKFQHGDILAYTGTSTGVYYVQHVKDNKDRLDSFEGKFILITESPMAGYFVGDSAYFDRAMFQKVSSANNNIWKLL